MNIKCGDVGELISVRFVSRKSLRASWVVCVLIGSSTVRKIGKLSKNGAWIPLRQRFGVEIYVRCGGFLCKSGQRHPVKSEPWIVRSNTSCCYYIAGALKDDDGHQTRYYLQGLQTEHKQSNI